MVYSGTKPSERSPKNVTRKMTVACGYLVAFSSSIISMVVLHSLKSLYIINITYLPHAKHMQKHICYFKGQNISNAIKIPPTCS